MYASPDTYIPQRGSLRRPWLTWSALVFGCLALLSLIVGAPFAVKAGHTSLGAAIYRGFSYFCHQIPERSFFIAGHQFAVCSRCTGLYAGFALAVLMYPMYRSLRQIEAPPRKWLFLAATPLALDFALGFFGVWDNTHSSRFVTGALLGAVAVFFVMPGLMDLSLRDWQAKKRAAGPVVEPNETLAAQLFSQRAGTTPSDYSAPERRI